MNTLISALIAASILFLSNMMTLFTNDPTLTFNTIATAGWVSMCGGGLMAFLKDYQTLTTRRLINKATKSGDGGI